MLLETSGPSAVPEAIAFLPHVNAALNSTSAVCLLSGYFAIRRGAREVHRRWMIGALTASSVFLASYLTYHYFGGMTRFSGEGLARAIYFAILISHTILAVACAPLVIVTVRFAIRGNFERHRRWARVTFPIWLYVSITGVIVYAMLYHLYPASTSAA